MNPQGLPPELIQALMQAYGGGSNPQSLAQGLMAKGPMPANSGMPQGPQPTLPPMGAQMMAPMGMGGMGF